MADAPVPFDASPDPAGAGASWRKRVAGRVLVVYAAVLALIAFWPTPVDREAAGVLRAIARAVPLLSYGVVEFTANIALFVPFGVLLALALPRRRGLAVPIAVAVSLVIESGQAMFLAQRTPSLRDIVANTLGASVGLTIVLILDRRAAAGRARRRTEQ